MTNYSHEVEGKAQTVDAFALILLLHEEDERISIGAEEDTTANARTDSGCISHICPDAAAVLKGELLPFLCSQCLCSDVHQMLLSCSSFRGLLSQRYN